MWQYRHSSKGVGYFATKCLIEPCVCHRHFCTNDFSYKITAETRKKLSRTFINGRIRFMCENCEEAFLSHRLGTSAPCTSLEHGPCTRALLLTFVFTGRDYGSCILTPRALGVTYALRLHLVRKHMMISCKILEHFSVTSYS